MIEETLIAITNEGDVAIRGSNYVDFIVFGWSFFLGVSSGILLPLVMEDNRRVKAWQFFWLNYVVALGLWVFSQLPNLDPRVTFLRAPILGMIAAFAIAVAATSQQKWPDREIAITARLVIPFALAAMSYAFSLPTLTLLSLPGQALLRQLFVLLCFYAACLAGSCGLSRLNVESWFRTTKGETIQSQRQTIAK